MTIITNETEVITVINRVFEEFPNIYKLTSFKYTGGTNYLVEIWVKEVQRINGGEKEIDDFIEMTVEIKDFEDIEITIL